MESFGCGESVASSERIKSAKRKHKEKMYSFNRALRNNVLLTEELKTNQRRLSRDKDRNNQLTDHDKAMLSVTTRHLTKTSNWMCNHLNQNLLVMERGRHMQVVKPYFHGPGKPLTPYQTKLAREKLRAEKKKAAFQAPFERGVFLRFREPRRFSALRDNSHVVDLTRKFED